MNPIRLTDNVSVPEGVLIREVAGEAVLLNLNNEQYYGLNAVGLRMWQVLTAGRNIEQTIEELLQEYDVDRATLEGDILQLLEELAGQGLVEIADVG